MQMKMFVKRIKNVQDHGGYFKANVQDHGGYCEKMYRIMVDILCYCARSWRIFWENGQIIWYASPVSNCLRIATTMRTIPSIESQYKNRTFILPLLSDAALTFFEEYNKTAAVSEGAKQTANNYTSSSMLYILPLSAIIQCDASRHCHLRSSVMNVLFHAYVHVWNATFY